MFVKENKKKTRAEYTHDDNVIIVTYFSSMYILCTKSKLIHILQLKNKLMINLILKPIWQVSTDRVTS